MWGIYRIQWISHFNFFERNVLTFNLSFSSLYLAVFLEDCFFLDCSHPWLIENTHRGNMRCGMDFSHGTFSAEHFWPVLWNSKFFTCVFLHCSCSGRPKVVLWLASAHWKACTLRNLWSSRYVLVFTMMAKYVDSYFEFEIFSRRKFSVAFWKRFLTTKDCLAAIQCWTSVLINRAAIE